MSYDLYFYKKKNSKLTESDIKSEFKELVPNNISEVDHQIDYENERTGVYFLIDFNEPNTEKEDIELFENFEGYDYVNISASINFFRPDYFGTEIFPLICGICDKLDLFILNLQESDETKHRPTKWTGLELVEHWISNNAKVTKQQFEELNLNFLDKND